MDGEHNCFWWIHHDNQCRLRSGDDGVFIQIIGLERGGQYLEMQIFGPRDAIDAANVADVRLSVDAHLFHGSVNCHFHSGVRSPLLHRDEIRSAIARFRRGKRRWQA